MYIFHLSNLRHRFSGAFLFYDTYCRCAMNGKELSKLGQIIREKREAKSLTQVEVAEKAQLDRNYIGMVERGERNPSYLSLLKIASGLGMEVYELIKP